MTRAFVIARTAGLFGRHAHFLEQVVGVIEVVHHPQLVTNIDLDRAVELWVEQPVATQRLPVAVERQADRRAVRGHRRRAGVAAGDVEVGEEGDRQRTQHQEVAFVHAFADDLQMRERRVRPVVLRVIRRLAVRPDIGAQHGKIAPRRDHMKLSTSSP